MASGSDVGLTFRFVALTFFVVALVCSGCNIAGGNNGTDSVSEYGPMTVRDNPDGHGHDASGGIGILTVGDKCVYMRREGSDEQITLVWSSHNATWDSDDRAVVLSLFGQPKPLRLHDGDLILIGGSEAVSNDLQWLARPDDSCPPRRWVINDIGLAE